MRNLILILLSTAMAFFVSLILPWWVALIPPAMVAACVAKSRSSVFFLSACPTALLWTILCVYSMGAGSDLPGRVATLFYLPHSILLLLITVLLGGILSGTLGVAIGETAGLVRTEKSD